MLKSLMIHRRAEDIMLDAAGCQQLDDLGFSWIGGDHVVSSTGLIHSIRNHGDVVGLIACTAIYLEDMDTTKLEAAR